MITAWTDYPFTELGDAEGQRVPMREIKVLSYDGDKYCQVRAGEIEAEIKSGYIYQRNRHRVTRSKLWDLRAC